MAASTAQQQSALIVALQKNRGEIAAERLAQLLQTLLLAPPKR